MAERKADIGKSQVLLKKDKSYLNKVVFRLLMTNKDIPQSLEDCFLLDRRNESCWSFLQDIIVHTLLGVGYTVNLADSQGNVKVRYTYARPMSFFSYGAIDEFLWDFGARRERVEQAVKKVPEESDNIFYNREDEIKVNMYQFRGRPTKVLTNPERNAHTLACSWKSSDLVSDELSVFRNMKVYLCLDWDSLGRKVPPPNWDDDKLYRVLEFGREAINTAFRYWLARNTDFPLVQEVSRTVSL